jgi:hypothetical protein
MVVFSLIAPVSALYFDFSYFETDQVVYEVGENINMIARLVADFAPEGWCYVSFAIVTDTGTVYTDAYFIPPSPDIRDFSSSYTILPEDTFPGDQGVLAYATFNIEIFDKYSQGTTETIILNISRGGLNVFPLTPLSIGAHDNGTVSFLIASEHNSSIVLPDSPVSVEIFDSNMTELLDTVTMSNASGMVSIDWEPGTYLSGDYTLRITGNESDCFDAFSKTFSIAILPTPSYLNVLSAPATVLAQAPDGSNHESVLIRAQHVDANNQSLPDSIAMWSTPFSSGSMSYVGNGVFEASIPFTVGAGTYAVNLTAVNPSYQNATLSLPIQVLHRPVNVSISTSQLLAGDNSIITIALIDSIIEYTPQLGMNISLVYDDIVLSILGTANSSGTFQWNPELPGEAWGSGTLSVHILSNDYYVNSTLQDAVRILYRPEVVYFPVLNTARGLSASINVSVLTPLGQAISNLPVELRNTTGELVASGTTDSFGSVTLTWVTPSDMSIGFWNFSIFTVEDDIQYICELCSPIQVVVNYPIFFSPHQPNLECVRGYEAALEFDLTSEPGINGTFTLVLSDTIGGTVFYTITNLGINRLVLIIIPANASVGFHSFSLAITEPGFLITYTITQSLTVFSSISAIISSPKAYYNDALELTIAAFDDNSSSLTLINLSASFDSKPLFYLENVNTLYIVTAPLPWWLSPGVHNITLVIYAEYTTELIIPLQIRVWMQTSLSFSINTDNGGGLLPLGSSLDQDTPQEGEIAATISSGSINNPPPILFNGTTLVLPETRFTSLTSCPRLSSGTNMESTDAENSDTTLSGNGHRVLSRSDLQCPFSVGLFITCSTARETLPKETIPHSALSDPSITTSVSKSEASTILLESLRTRRS